MKNVRIPERNIGVPQGSVLGLVLFRIHINSLELILSTQVARFANATEAGHVSIIIKIFKTTQKKKKGSTRSEE